MVGAFGEGWGGSDLERKFLLRCHKFGGERGIWGLFGVREGKYLYQGMLEQWREAKGDTGNWGH